MKIVDMTKISLDEENRSSKGTFLIVLGCKEGKVLTYRFGTVSNNLLLTSKGGVSFGAITSVDVSPNGSDIMAGSESGEILHFELLKKLNEGQE
jgi:hypothetical protein